MRRRLGLLGVVLSFVLAGCGGGDGAVAPADAEKNKQQINSLKDTMTKPPTGKHSG
jgi:hypothetical protein